MMHEIHSDALECRLEMLRMASLQITWHNNNYITYMRTSQIIATPGANKKE
jgi:hypothetical protein